MIQEEVNGFPNRLAASIVMGLLMATTGIGLGSLLKLAYERNALEESKLSFAAMLLNAVEWPNSILMFLDVTRTDFFHPHIGGASFWPTVVEHLVVNFIGWSLAIYFGWILASRLLTTTRST